MRRKQGRKRDDANKDAPSHLLDSTGTPVSDLAAMTLDQLRIFVAVAEREHVTRAAEALHLTQSTVSAAIAALETRHGVPLFHRVGRRIELTEAGRSVLPEALRVLAQAKATERVLAEFADLDHGTLAIAASQTIASYWLPERLAAFHRARPGIEMQVAIGNTSQVARAVIDGSAELGLVEGAVDEPALAATTVGADQLIIVAGSGASPPMPIAAGDLLELIWVSREPGSGTRMQLEASLTRLGLDVSRLRIDLELPSNEAVLGAVEACVGIAGISKLVAAPRLRGGTLRELDVKLDYRSFQLLRHRERRPSRAARAFVDGLNLP